MGHVLANGKQKGSLGITVEIAHEDRLLPAELRGTQSVHSVDDPHGRPVHKNRR